MIVGVPREIKDNEYRVGLPPDAVAALVADGHAVRVERGAGAGSGFPDPAYERAGAGMTDVDGAFAADIVVKVKEPQPPEYGRLRRGQVLFTFLHLAASKPLTEGMLQSGVTAIAYEAVEDARGRLPLLAPMSEVAGCLAVLLGAGFLERRHGGRGLLLTGAAGVPPGTVTVLGAGVVGSSAVRVAVGLGARVSVLDQSEEALERLRAAFPGVRTGPAAPEAVADAVARTDLLVGAVLVPGAHAPRMVTREMLRAMSRGAVVVDVSIDQGGCVEGIRETTHTDPTYVEDGVVFSAIPNLPGVVPLTSTRALAGATLPYVRAIAAKGWRDAARADPGLAEGVRMTDGHLCHTGIAEAFGLPYNPLAL